MRIFPLAPRPSHTFTRGGQSAVQTRRRIRAWFRRELALSTQLGTCDRGPTKIKLGECGNLYYGGYCTLPMGHNIGRPDIPENHRLEH